MKQSDFDDLKRFCDRKGYELLNESPEDNTKFFVVKKAKDIWEGVEFCKVGKIHRIKSIDKDRIHFNDETWSYKDRCQPSTEEAFVKQLKAKAFKMFGEIKEGEEFTNVYGYKSSKPDFDMDHWYYRKNDDTFFAWGVAIYQQGKWATKLLERVKVRIKDFDTEYHSIPIECLTVNFGLENYGNDLEKIEKSSQFLAIQLEKYLNGEIE